MKKLLTAPIKFYQKWISPMFAPRCKYYPSCSSYAVSAIENYGLKGIAMSLWRLVRCNPWSRGGVDYVQVKDTEDLSKKVINKEKLDEKKEKVTIDG
jgi:putative membrane protein insertion efficiency factor